MTIVKSIGRAIFGVALVLPALAAPANAQARTDTTLARRIQFGATLGLVPDSLKNRGAPSGALILGIVPGSPAADAGLTPGDIITRIRSDTVIDVTSALAALRPIVAGSRNDVGFSRSGFAAISMFVGRERPRETSNEFTIEYRAVTAAGGKRRVLVAHPNDDARHPTVLLLGGIGCYAVDVPAGVSAYRDLMYDLTRRGYTTVRVEKLGIGDSEGSSCLTPDFDTELDGYRAALDAMRTYPSVDPARMFLLGHSIGGIEAPLLASSDTAPRVRGVAVLSTTGIAWYEYELTNLRRQLVLQNLAPDSIERAMYFKTTCTYQLLLELKSRDSISAHQPRCARYLGYPASDAYMQQVATHDPASAWKGVTSPVLVMHGASDFVTSRDEHVQLVDAINAMHPGSATYADIPEIDHYMSHQASEKTSITDPVTGLLRPYYGATLEPILSAWLDRLSGQRPI